MRLFIAGPRTLLRWVILISLPSLVMFLFLCTQTLLPSGLITRLGRGQQEELYFPFRREGGGEVDEFYNYSMLGVTNSLSDIDFFADGTAYDAQSKYNGSMLVNTTWGSHPSALEYKPVLDLPTALRDAPNKPPPEDLERYLMENFKINQQKGFTHFSLDVTEAMIEQGPLHLPELLPNLKVPCWVEEVPRDFTYKDNIYHCHINHRRMAASFDIMYATYQQRQRYSGFKWRLRCLPSFYLIGVAKCGTTDLFEALTRHPQVLKPDLKEPEFWPYLRFGLNDLILNMTCAQAKGRATFADYMDTYDLTSEMMKESLRTDPGGNISADVFFGDYSTHTFIDIFDWDKTLDAPEQINAHHIYNVWPKSKFILILRDPVDRSYSRYKMRMTRQGNVAGTPQDYHKRVVRQVKSTSECLASYSRRYCVYKATYGAANLGTNALLNTGLYSIYLTDWLSIFPREQILIIKFEDYVRDRSTNIERIINFLGMDVLSSAHSSMIDNMSIVNAGPNIGQIMPETRAILQEFFRPFNKELVEMLGEDRFSWGY